MRARTAASLSSGQSESRLPCTNRIGVRSASNTSSRIAPVAPDCSGYPRQITPATVSSSATWQPTRPPIDLPIRNSGPAARARSRPAPRGARRSARAADRASCAPRSCTDSRTRPRRRASPADRARRPSTPTTTARRRRARTRRGRAHRHRWAPRRGRRLRSGVFGTKQHQHQAGHAGQEGDREEHRVPDPLVDGAREPARERARASDTTAVASAKCDAEKAARQRCMMNTEFATVPMPATNCSASTIGDDARKLRLEDRHRDVERDREVLKVRHRHQAARQALARDERAAEDRRPRSTR